MEKFFVGLALGMVGGAIIVTNSYKVRSLVKKNQEDLKAKAEEYIDEKLGKIQKEKDEMAQSEA